MGTHNKMLRNELLPAGLWVVGLRGRIVLPRLVGQGSPFPLQITAANKAMATPVVAR